MLQNTSTQTVDVLGLFGKEFFSFRSNFPIPCDTCIRWDNWWVKKRVPYKSTIYHFIAGMDGLFVCVSIYGTINFCLYAKASFPYEPWGHLMKNPDALNINGYLLVIVDSKIMETRQSYDLCIYFQIKLSWNYRQLYIPKILYF